MLEVHSKIDRAIDRTITDVFFDNLSEQGQREAEKKLRELNINEFLVD